jgi:hypothetical protein
MRRIERRLGSCCVALAALAACSDSPSQATEDTLAGVRVLNATGSGVDVSVDGVPTEHLGPSLVSARYTIPSGGHQLVVVADNGVVVRQSTMNFAVVAPSRFTTYAWPGGPDSLTLDYLPDSATIVPAGKSKVRVLHLAENAPALDIWRTQPDFPTPVKVVFPFTFNSAPLSYMQSDAGTWTVWITPESDSSVHIASVTFNVPGGERRTVALVDSVGTLRLRVLIE